jgi:hypothetical protein
MSLYDSAKSKINGVLNSIKIAANASITSTTITYGFIGITTAILSYYTFFEKDIEEIGEQPETKEPETKEPVTEEPIVEEQPAQTGGKSRKKTRRNK